MTNTEYRDWMIKEIITDRKKWCKRNKVTKEDLQKMSTRSLERIYDYAK